MLKRNKTRLFSFVLVASVLKPLGVSAQIPGTDDILRRLPEVEVGLDPLDRLPLDEPEVLEDTLDNLEPVLGLSELPLRLEIPTLQGGTALVEVAVENGWRALEREWLLLAKRSALRSSQWQGVDILEKHPLPALDMYVLRVRVTESLDGYRRLRALLADKGVEQFDRNHVFEAQTSINVPTAPQEGGMESPKQQKQEARKRRENIVIGMVDTAVSRAHPALLGANIERGRFVEAGVAEAEAHGTAVASLIVGQGVVKGLLPEAKLYSASAFYSRHERSQGATGMSLLQALNWLVSQGVGVINMSLTGPPNTLLQRAIDSAWEKGIPVVAAVGNAGPLAPPQYPAAWEKVVAVTAVDREQQIYRWAVQGEHLDFSAQGVAVEVARVPDSVSLESGTSLAAPIVSCLLAEELAVLSAQPGPQSIGAVLNKFKLRVRDLGEPGRDTVFGYGYLQTSLD